MFYVWALLFRSLTQFALNIKFASLERMGMWVFRLKQMLETSVGLTYFFLCMDLIALSLDFYIVVTR